MKYTAWALGSALALATIAHADDSLQEVVILADKARAATKTDTELVEIPQSVSVVTAEQIAERGVQNYQEIFRYSAGVDTERFGSDTRGDDFSARGFPMVQYVDGLNKTPDTLYGSRTEVYTLERAEILRGPSAVLYGAGSAGGLLNAVSKTADFRFGGEMGLQLGNHERKQVQGDVTGALFGSDSVAGRIVGVVRDGELESDGEADDKVVVMPSLIWKPTEKTDVTFLLLYQQEDLGTQTYLPLSKTLSAPTDAERLAVDFFVGEPDFNRMKTDQIAGTFMIDHELSDTISAATHTRYVDQTVDYAEVYGSYYQGIDPFVDPERTLLSREFYILDEDYQILTTDNHLLLNFETGPITHKVLVGADYTRFEQDRQEGFSCRGVTDGSFGCFIGGSPPPLNIYNPVYGAPFDVGFTNAFTTRSTQLGLYLQDQIKLGERVSFVAGVRRDRATSEASGSPEDENRATTFRAGLIVEAFKGFSPYVSYSESFLPVFGGDFFGNPFKPREGRQYEVGVKWQPLANSLVTFAVFDIEDKNFITSDPDNLQNFIQSGAVGAEGFEIEAIANLPGNFSVTAGYSYTKAEVLEGTIDHPAGDRLEELPEHLASVWAAKTLDINESWALRLGAGIRRVGDKIDYFQLQETPPVTLGDVVIEANSRQWQLSLNINNVTDKEFYAICGQTSAPFGVCHPGLTRRIVGTVTRRF